MPLRKEEQDKRVNEIIDAAIERGENTVVIIEHDPNCTRVKDGYGCNCVPDFVELPAEVGE